jgi:hypothetical protein
MALNVHYSNLYLSIYKLKLKTLSYLCHVACMAMPSARHILYLLAYVINLFVHVKSWPRVNNKFK